MNSGSILLIDDNVIQAKTRQAILMNAGYDVIAVLDPVQALTMLDTRDAVIWLVITDHIMPGMTGSALVKRLRVGHPTLPVIVISGLEEAEEEYKSLGVVFRAKPLLPETLLTSVHELQ